LYLTTYIFNSYKVELKIFLSFQLRKKKHLSYNTDFSPFCTFFPPKTFSLLFFLGKDIPLSSFQLKKKSEYLFFGKHTPKIFLLFKICCLR